VQPHVNSRDKGLCVVDVEKKECRGDTVGQHSRLSLPSGSFGRRVAFNLVTPCFKCKSSWIVPESSTVSSLLHVNTLDDALRFLFLGSGDGDKHRPDLVSSPAPSAWLNGEDLLSGACFLGICLAVESLYKLRPRPESSSRGPPKFSIS